MAERSKAPGSPVFHALRQGYHAAIDVIDEAGRPDHDHGSDGPCPACEAAGEAVAMCVDTALACAPPPEMVTYRCWRCRDTTWIPLHGTDPSELRVRPCENCTPEVYERWARGHYRPGHSEAHCEECLSIRRYR